MYVCMYYDICKAQIPTENRRSNDAMKLNFFPIDEAMTATSWRLATSQWDLTSCLESNPRPRFYCAASKGGATYQFWRREVSNGDVHSEFTVGIWTHNPSTGFSQHWCFRPIGHRSPVVFAFQFKFNLFNFKHSF